MTIEVNRTVESKHSYQVISGKTAIAKRTVTRVAYERKRPNIKRSFFPATPFDAQSLAGTGALVFEGEMLRNGN